jgi:hypothetical protein
VQPVAFGWCACGNGHENGSLSISSVDVANGTPAPVRVHVSVGRNSGGSDRGKVGGEVVVPWWGEARQNLADGGWLEARLVRPGER